MLSQFRGSKAKSSNVADSSLEDFAFRVKNSFGKSIGPKYLTYVVTEMVGNQLQIVAGLKSQQAMHEFTDTIYVFTDTDGKKYEIPIRKKLAGVARLHLTQRQSRCTSVCFYRYTLYRRDCISYINL